MEDLDIAAMAERMGVLKDRHKLTFLAAEGNEDTKEDTIMVQGVVGMAEVVVQVVGHITHKDRCSFDGMADFAAVVDGPVQGKTLSLQTTWVAYFSSQGLEKRIGGIVSG